MWCARCQADVAAEATPDNQRLHCVTCGCELASNAPPGGTGADKPGGSKDPYALLARWSGDPLLDPFGPLPVPPRQPASGDDSGNNSGGRGRNSRRDESADDAKSRAHRFDAAHDSPPASRQPEPARKPVRRPKMLVPRAQPQVRKRIHSAEQLHAPHFAVQPQPQSQKSTNWVAVAGQICAYLGVGTLTIGTTVVLVGYFGGPAHYAPMGWLITTVGQMLLFLGVVTLVSGGMEQTTHEVARRIDVLGQRLVRMEQTALAGSSDRGRFEDEDYESDDDGQDD